MNRSFRLLSTILNENDLESKKPITPEEKAKRSRMVRRMAGLGMIAGAGVTAAELMAHKGSRSSIMRSLQAKKLGTKLKGVGKQIWKPMAIGIGADLAIEPTNTKIAQAMEDKYQQKKKTQSKPKVG